MIYTMKSFSMTYVGTTVALLTVFAMIVFPAPTSAYVTTDQNVVRLSDTAALFTITYQFGHKDLNFYMPIVPVRDLAHDSHSKNLGFEILEDGDNATTEGTATGIVLSGAPIVDGMYRTPADRFTQFMLVVLFTVPDEAEENDYALHVQELPFYMGDDREYQKLNPSELQYYVTPTVSLNDL